MNKIYGLTCIVKQMREFYSDC